MRGISVTLVVSFVLLTAAALAKPAYQGQFLSVGKIKAGTKLATAGCSACHVGHGPALNPFGTDLKKVTKGAAALTANHLKAVANLDSDKDKLKNGAELKKGTLPGDPKSK